MLDQLNPKQLSYVPFKPKSGTATHEVLTPTAFQAAIEEITAWPGYAPTPLHALNGLARSCNVAKIYYKDEALRFGLDSFKALGGAYAALQVLKRELTAQLGRDVSAEEIRLGKLTHEVKKITIVSATDGNHGRSLAWGCQQFGANCKIYIHAEVSKSREDAIAELGAQIIRIAGDYDDSVDLARAEAKENGWFIVSDTSWDGYRQPPKDVMAGYGVMTSEICAQLDTAPTHVFLQGGVGGLAASVIAYLDQYWGVTCPRAVIVEPELAACLFVSAKAGKRTTFQIENETTMSGLSCGEPSPLAWQILEQTTQDFVTIPETYIAPVLDLLKSPHQGDPEILAGESAVAGVSAFIAISKDANLRAQMDIDANSRILFIGSEGITDPVSYNRLIEGLAHA